MQCIEQVQLDGRHGLVMTRINGSTLTSTSDDNPLNLFKFPGVLAQLHAKIHGLHTAKLTDIKTIFNRCLEMPALDFLDQRQKEALRNYVSGLPNGDAVLHMDFHTDNILVENGAPVLIDWMTAARGVPEAELAMTWFLFNEAELFPGISRAKEIFYGTVRTLIYKSYYKRYMKLRNSSWERVQVWLLPIFVIRLALWQAKTEVQKLREKILVGVSALG